MKNNYTICLFLTLFLFLFIYAGAYAGDKTSVSVSVAPSGKGKVYVEPKGKNSIVSADQINQTSMKNENGSSHFYTLYANPDKGYAFKEWKNTSASSVKIGGVKSGQINGDTYVFDSTDNPLHINVKSSSTSEIKSTIEAVFVPAVLTVVSSDYTIGHVKISKAENVIGDIVTLTAAFNTPHSTWQEGPECKHSQSVAFDGWYDGKGNLISEELTVEYTVKEEETLVARFFRKEYVLSAYNDEIKGYFRMIPAFSRGREDNNFLCVTGNFNPTINTSSGTSLTASMQFNQVPYKHSKTYAATDSVFSNAGSIIYLTGTLVPGKQETIESYVKVASNIVAEAQGVSTTQILESAGKNLSPWLATSNTPGFYMLYLMNSITLQRTTSGGEEVYVSTDHLDQWNNRDCGDFDIQPVDIEHIDTNYFGAIPSESMEFDGGYWTSMYTSFPYECYEEDGVEAWVINGKIEKDGAVVVTPQRLESGIVTPATPVLLKCKGLKPKENRLIPLLPDDERLADAAVATEGNLLSGDYGLWTANDYTGRTKFDAANMRVFSISNGELGFYKLAANENGVAKELVPNRAYLDMSKLNTTISEPVAVRLDFGSSGIGEIESVAPMRPQDNIIYDLSGRRVVNPQPGSVYIRNGRKFVMK